MHTILSGWNFARWLRLAAGLIIGILSIRMQDELGGFIAALFVPGCCEYWLLQCKELSGAKEQKG